MLPDPLHPALVHLPLALVLLLPIAAAAALWAIHRGAPPTRTWLPVAVGHALLAAAAWAALRAGGAEEDVVEHIVPHDALEQHEELAETFLGIAAGALVVALGGLVGGRVGAWARGLAALATLVLLAVGYQVGMTGGDLVYRHGAARAHVQRGAPGTTRRRGAPEEAEEDREEARDERDERRD